MIASEEAYNDHTFETLSTIQLIEAYDFAKELDLSLEFQHKLAEAIRHRQSK